MDALVIEGPARLRGTVAVNGSKNTALPLLFASLLFDEEVAYENVPRLWDIETTLHLLESMGVESIWDKGAGIVRIFPRVRHKVAPYEWVKRMRAGILALGPLIARYGEACVSLPGGCAIGARPVNFHIDALEKMGVAIKVEEGYIKGRVKSRLTGARIRFPQVTVTGTENVLFVAAMADGETVIENAAREPEVVALARALVQWGVEIAGIGTPTLRVRGGGLSRPTRPVRIPPDRIEAGTWIAAATVTSSELVIEACDASEMRAVIEAFRGMGVGIEVESDGTRLRVSPSDRLRPIRLATAPYPGFPTDMQAQILTAMCLASGESEIEETIFENRFMHVAELSRLGAKVTVEGNKARVHGPCDLIGAPLMATDLRASASLVLAGLCARGQTKVSRIYHLDRGYQKLDQKLTALGAVIRRVEE